MEADMCSTLTEFTNEHRINSGEFRSTMQKQALPKTAEDLFFDSCALRMQKLSPAKKSLLQLQISQLFYNAENPDVFPVALTTNESHRIQTDTAWAIQEIHSMIFFK